MTMLEPFQRFKEKKKHNLKIQKFNLQDFFGHIRKIKRQHALRKIFFRCDAIASAETMREKLRREARMQGFVELGGLVFIKDWIQEGIETGDYSLCVTCLKVLAHDNLPFDLGVIQALELSQAILQVENAYPQAHRYVKAVKTSWNAKGKKYIAEKNKKSKKKKAVRWTDSQGGDLETSRVFRRDDLVADPDEIVPRRVNDVNITSILKETEKIDPDEKNPSFVPKEKQKKSLEVIDVDREKITDVGQLLSDDEDISIVMDDDEDIELKMDEDDDVEIKLDPTPPPPPSPPLKARRMKSPPPMMSRPLTPSLSRPQQNGVKQMTRPSIVDSQPKRPPPPQPRSQPPHPQPKPAVKQNSNGHPPQKRVSMVVDGSSDDDSSSDESSSDDDAIMASLSSKSAAKLSSSLSSPKKQPPPPHPQPQIQTPPQPHLQGNLTDPPKPKESSQQNANLQPINSTVKSAEVRKIMKRRRKFKPADVKTHSTMSMEIETNVDADDEGDFSDGYFVFPEDKKCFVEGFVMNRNRKRREPDGGFTLMPKSKRFRSDGVESDEDTEEKYGIDATIDDAFCQNAVPWEIPYRWQKLNGCRNDEIVTNDVLFERRRERVVERMWRQSEIQISEEPRDVAPEAGVDTSTCWNVQEILADYPYYHLYDEKNKTVGLSQ